MTTPVPEPVARVASLGEGLVDVAPLRAAIEGWSAAPWRVAVVGRTAVGKSTLVNALVGRRVLRTGLGGVTAEAHAVEQGDVEWIDTPGLDGPQRDAILDLLPGADAAVWVVDGLQPMTAGEREALAPLRGLLVHVVVSRLDRLDPVEVPSVIERVRSLAAPWSPATLHAVDLRAAERSGSHALDDLAVAAPWRSARRTGALRDALGGIERALRALPPPPDRIALTDALVARWREVVREVTAPIEAAVRAGHVEHRAASLRWLGAAAIPARDAFVAGAAAAIAPLVPRAELDLALPEVPAHGPLDLVGGLGGASAALREIRRVAARWLLDGESTLREWVVEGAADPGPVSIRAALDHAVPEALGALDTGPRRP